MGCKPYPDAPCVVCGKIVHPYAKGMCRSCYYRFRNYGATTPPRQAVIPLGTTRHGWTRISHDGDVCTYKCADCGAIKIVNNYTWPKGKCECVRKHEQELSQQAPRAARDETQLTDPVKREALKRRIWAQQDKVSCKTIMRREAITREELDELYDEAIRDYKDEATKHTMVGLHYAAWEVLEIGGVYIGPQGHEAHYYLCRCKCGKTKTIKGGDLIKRTIRDCGCGAGAAIPPPKPRKPKDPRWENYMGGVTAHV